MSFLDFDNPSLNPLNPLGDNQDTAAPIMSLHASTQSAEVIEKAQKIKLFAMDVDGILTDGKIIYDSQGSESKEFNVMDGLGLSALRQHGFILAIITGRNSPMVTRRAEELGIHHIIQGRDDKFAALSTLADSLGIPLEACAYMGDDLPDLKAVRLAGLGLTVPNAAKEVQAIANVITEKKGGEGAVREACELLLSAAGHYASFLERYS